MTDTKFERSAVYSAIDSERNYQDSLWNEHTTTSGGVHSLEEWYTYISSYVREAQELLSRKSKQEADPLATNIMRKVAAMAVCAMEQHGAPRR